MRLVLDSSAVIAYLRGETGAEEIREVLRDKANTCLIHAVNLCEIYYIVLREKDQSTAAAAVGALPIAGVEVREDMDPQFWQTSGKHKAALARISLADCFCLSLALREDAVILTTDHKEFGPVSAQGICQVKFIR